MKLQGEAPMNLFTVDSKKLKHGFKVIHAVVSSFSCFGMRVQSYSNFLVSTGLPESPKANIPRLPMVSAGWCWGLAKFA